MNVDISFGTHYVCCLKWPWSCTHNIILFFYYLEVSNSEEATKLTDIPLHYINIGVEFIKVKSTVSFSDNLDKMKNKIYHTPGTVLKFNDNNCRKRHNWYTWHTNTWQLAFLAWYKHLNKNVAGSSQNINKTAIYNVVIRQNLYNLLSY